MSASKTPAEVGRGMEQYDVRTGNDPLPRETNPTNLIHCFDKGHHRVLSAYRLQNVQNDANGAYVVIRGRRIPMQAVNSVLGVPLPVGFVAVPKQYILQHFSTRYGRNIIKMKRKLEEYHKECSEYLRDRFEGTDLGLPRRPTLKSLNLDSPTEFESFLVPLKSFFHKRLKGAFASLVRDAEDGQWTVFTNMNQLALPDVVGGVREDRAAELRWNAARTEYIAVRIQNFDTLTPNMLVPQYPAPRLPYPPNAPAAPVAAGARPVLAPTQMEIDEKMLEQCRLGVSTKWKGLFLYMTPWQDATPVHNPFVSPEYRLAYEVAQNGFARRHAEFKRTMVAKRTQHSREWRAYAAYRNEMKSVFMLDSNRLPVNPYAERPQIEHFAEEWKHFAFGLKEEMKNFVFVPINVAAAPPGFVGGAYYAFAPNVQAYKNISSSVLHSAKRMFLI